MKLGTIALRPGAAFAPMAGFSDAAARRLMAEQGASFTVSEMVSAKALCHDDRKSLQLLRWSNRPKEVPYGVQLFGGDAESMGEAAKRIAGEDFDFYDINMGCPAPKITNNGCGSKLMLTPELCGQIVAAVVQNAGERPVSVKMRTGWDDDHKTAVEVAKACEQAGAALLVVHGRTREKMYAPGVDFAMIEKVKNAVQIPVLGNGDITSAETALQMQRLTGCDGVMIGRAALGNPWLFEQVAAALQGEPEPAAPTLRQRMAAFRSQIYEMCEREGEHKAMPPARGQAMHYMAGLRGAAELRRECGCLECFADVDRLIQKVYDLQRE
mgnify:CR=1 FL=1